VIESKQRPGHVIEVHGGKAVSHGNIQLGKRSGGDHQLFRFIPAGNNLYMVESKLRSFSGLDIVDWGRRDQTNIQLAFRGPTLTSAAMFKMVDCGDGCIGLISGFDDQLRVGVADDNQNIVSRNHISGDRTRFQLHRAEPVPPVEKSVEKSATKGELILENDTDGPIEVSCVDLQGFERLIVVLRTNETWSCTTNHGYFWLLRRDGKQVGSIRITEEDKQAYQITGHALDVEIKLQKRN